MFGCFDRLLDVKGWFDPAGLIHVHTLYPEVMHFPVRRILVKFIDVFTGDGEVVEKKQIDRSVRVCIQISHKELDILDSVANDVEGMTKAVNWIKGMPHTNGIVLQLD